MRNRAIQGGASIIAMAMAGSALAQSAPTPPATPTGAPDTTAECGGATNCSLIEQDGSNLIVDVTQENSGNVSDIEQVDASNGSRADIDQTGTNASSYVRQSDTDTPNFPTEANVEQTGDGADSIVIQVGVRNAKANVEQDGESDSFINQSGSGGSARVIQGGGDTNDSVIFQEGHIDFDSQVRQTGNENVSEVYQGDFSGSGTLTAGQRNDIRQTGDRNRSFVAQTIFRVGNRDSDVDIVQTGDDNISSVVQTGNRANHDVSVTQDGSDNLSRIEQEDFNTVDVGGNQIVVDQTNDGNDSFVDQTSGSGSSVNITQISDDTSGSVSGVTRASLFGGTNTVRGNYSEVDQSGTGVSEADLRQEGFRNSSDIWQINNQATAADANVNQYGQDNDVAIFQGSNNTANVDQGTALADANGNIASVGQSGGNNTANVNQTGDDNFARITHFSDGFDNTATVNQSASEGYAFIGQQGGSFNSGTVNQGIP